MDRPELPLSLPRRIFKDTQNADAVQQTFIRHGILDAKSVVTVGSGRIVL
jgi:hypothetical protein